MDTLTDALARWRTEMAASRTGFSGSACRSLGIAFGEHGDALLARLDAAEAVCEKAKWLKDTIDRDVDPADVGCLQAHGLIWHEMDKALAAWKEAT